MRSQLSIQFNDLPQPAPLRGIEWKTEIPSLQTTRGIFGIMAPPNGTIEPTEFCRPEGVSATAGT
jgi:hypothetical protein